MKSVESMNKQSASSRKPIDFRAWWIVTLLFLLTTVNFMDRMVLSSVGPVLQSQLHFSSTQYSYIVFAFMLGMTLGQLPMGILLDRIGVRVGLPATLAGWSLANMLQAAARTVAGFSGLRFVMGLFECGSVSGGLKAVGETLPSEFRALALGIFNTGFILGSVIAPPLVVFITMRFGWHAAFLLPSVAGMFWMIPWLRAYRKQNTLPLSTPSNEKAPTIRRLLGKPQTWGVILMRATSGPIAQFYWFWLPIYLVRGRGTSLGTMAWMASIAYFMGGSGNIIGGYVSGWMIQRGVSVDRSRKLTFTTGAVLCALCTFAVPLVTSVTQADFVVGLAFFGQNVMACALYAIISDVFPESTLARVTGMTGIGEGIIDMTLVLLTGVIVDRFSFLPVFLSGSALPIMSIAALFLLVRRCELIRFEPVNFKGWNGN